MGSVLKAQTAPDAFVKSLSLSEEYQAEQA